MQRNLIIISVVLIVGFALYGGYSYLIKKPEVTGQNQNMAQNSDLKIEVLKQGTGEGAENGNMVTVHYTGWLENGTKFDSSLDRSQPFSFPLGAGYVIKGWDLGVLGMKVGEKRKLTIPAELGYGTIAKGPIPVNSTLIFEVELLKIERS